MGSLRRLWRTWSQARLACKARLGDECEAFLSGRHHEFTGATNSLYQLVKAPSWMWLNPLAHGSIERVREIASERQPADQRSWGWQECRAAIAEELLRLSDDNHELFGRLQRQALRPLELDLVADPRVTPMELLQLAFFALKLEMLSEGSG